MSGLLITLKRPNITPITFVPRGCRCTNQTNCHYNPPLPPKHELEAHIEQNSWVEFPQEKAVHRYIVITCAETLKGGKVGEAEKLSLLFLIYVRNSHVEGFS